MSPMEPGLSMNRTSVLARLVALITASFVMAQTSEASAVGTRTFRLDTLEELKGGELEGISVDSLGRVRAGFVLGKVNRVYGNMQTKRPAGRYHGVVGYILK